MKEAHRRADALRLTSPQVAPGGAAIQTTEEPASTSSSQACASSAVVARLVVLAIAAALSACAFASEQVGISSAHSCIQHECRDPDAAEYTRCEAACKARYQK
jgi:hypothetical protein